MGISPIEELAKYFSLAREPVTQRPVIDYSKLMPCK
jgi:hypothetical protein